MTRFPSQFKTYELFLFNVARWVVWCPTGTAFLLTADMFLTKFNEKLYLYTLVENTIALLIASRLTPLENLFKTSDLCSCKLLYNDNGIKIKKWKFMKLSYCSCLDHLFHTLLKWSLILKEIKVTLFGGVEEIDIFDNEERSSQKIWCHDSQGK